MLGWEKKLTDFQNQMSHYLFRLKKIFFFLSHTTWKPKKQSGESLNDDTMFRQTWWLNESPNIEVFLQRATCLIEPEIDKKLQVHPNLKAWLWKTCPA